MSDAFARLKEQKAALYYDENRNEGSFLAAEQIFKNSGGLGVRLLPLPTPEGGSAQILSKIAAGVSAQTQLPDEAWKFINELLSSATRWAPTEKVLGYHFAIRKDYVAREILYLEAFPKYSCMLEKFPWELEEQYCGMIRNGVGVLCAEDTVEAFIEEGMQPYFEGREELDVCIQELESRLNLYYKE